MNEIDYQKVFQFQFHDISYIVSIKADTQGLFLELQQKFTGESWQNYYQPAYIEQITSKTGNLKRYNVFIKMLVSALTGTSDSVHIDILTHHDLEVQALRKSGTSNKITDPKFINKRYIIMSYMAEFDKVHYPLPLQFITNPSSQKLKLTIRRLSQQLQCHESNPKADSLIKQLTLTKHENQLLKSKIKMMIKNQNREVLGNGNNINNINKQIQEENKNIREELARNKQQKEEELGKKNKILEQQEQKIVELETKLSKYQQNNQQYEQYEQKFNRLQNDAKQVVLALEHSRQNEKKSKLKITNLQKQLQKMMKQLKKNQNTSKNKNNTINSPRKSDTGSIKSKSKITKNNNAQKNSSVYDSDTQSSRMRRNGRASPYRQNTKPIQSSKSAKKKKQHYERTNAISKYSNISNLYNKDRGNQSRSRSRSNSIKRQQRQQSPPSDNLQSQANITESIDYPSDNQQDNRISSTMARLRSHRNKKLIEEKPTSNMKGNEKKKVINPIEQKISSIASMMRNLRNRNNNCESGNIN